MVATKGSIGNLSTEGINTHLTMLFSDISLLVLIV